MQTAPPVKADEWGALKMSKTYDKHTTLFFSAGVFLDDDVMLQEQFIKGFK